MTIAAWLGVLGSAAAVTGRFPLAVLAARGGNIDLNPTEEMNTNPEDTAPNKKGV